MTKKPFSSDVSSSFYLVRRRVASIPALSPSTFRLYYPHAQKAPKKTPLYVGVCLRLKPQGRANDEAAARQLSSDFTASTTPLPNQTPLLKSIYPPTRAARTSAACCSSSRNASKITPRAGAMMMPRRTSMPGPQNSRRRDPSFERHQQLQHHQQQQPSQAERNERKRRVAEQSRAAQSSVCCWLSLLLLLSLLWSKTCSEGREQKM